MERKYIEEFYKNKYLYYKNKYLKLQKYIDDIKLIFPSANIKYTKELFNITVDGCIDIDIDEKLIEINSLHKCVDSGPILLNKIETLAKKLKIPEVSLMDASMIENRCYHINLAIYKIITKGESWYNSMGYISIDNDSEKIANDIVCNLTLQEFFYNREYFIRALKKVKDDLSGIKFVLFNSIEEINSIIINPFDKKDLKQYIKNIDKECTYVNTMTFQDYYISLLDYIDSEYSKDISIEIIKKYKKKDIAENIDKFYDDVTIETLISLYPSIKPTDTIRNIFNSQFNNMDKSIIVIKMINLLEVLLTYNIFLSKTIVID
jgi:hypothetical protein